jgi:hypothetical protein
MQVDVSTRTASVRVELNRQMQYIDRATTARRSNASPHIHVELLTWCCKLARMCLADHKCSQDHAHPGDTHGQHHSSTCCSALGGGFFDNFNAASHTHLKLL